MKQSILCHHRQLTIWWIVLTIVVVLVTMLELLRGSTDHLVPESKSYKDGVNLQLRSEKALLHTAGGEPTSDVSTLISYSSESRHKITENKSGDYKKNLMWLDRLNASDEYIRQTRETQIHRMQRIEQTCKTVPRFSKRFAFNGRTGFIAFDNVTYCVIPKTGTTNLLRKICIMIGPRCIDKIGNQNEHVFLIYSNKFTRGMNRDEILPYTSADDHRIDQLYSTPDKPESQSSASIVRSDHFLFAVVRDPWKRLVSIFIEKFLYSQDYKWLCSANKDWAVFNKMKVETNTTWTYRDFIEKCVIYQYDRSGIPGMNEHMRPMFASGAFCDLQYNFISKLETFKQDESAIIKQFNSTMDIDNLDREAYKYRKKNEKSGLTSASYTDYWRSIEPALIERLQQLYYIDIIMFEYQQHPLSDL